MVHLSSNGIIINPFAIRIALFLDIRKSFIHFTCCEIQPVPAAITVIFTLYHISVRIIAYPFPLCTLCICRNEHILIACHRSIRIKPVPLIRIRIIDFLITCHHTVVIPVILSILHFPSCLCRLIEGMLLRFHKLKTLLCSSVSFVQLQIGSALHTSVCRYVQTAV